MSKRRWPACADQSIDDGPEPHPGTRNFPRSESLTLPLPGGTIVDFARRAVVEFASGAARIAPELQT
jgi:hypothetical protein